MTQEDHSSFIKTPQQLIVVVLLAFLVPIIGILLLVTLVLNRPSADPAALAPEAVTARIQPVGRVEFGAAGGAAAGPRSGEDIVKSACAACHQAGVANAPKLGDTNEQTAIDGKPFAIESSKTGVRDDDPTMLHVRDDIKPAKGDATSRGIGAAPVRKSGSQKAPAATEEDISTDVVNEALPAAEVEKNVANRRRSNLPLILAIALIAIAGVVLGLYFGGVIKL